MITGRAKGGIARRDKLSPERRAEIARAAAAARWSQPKTEKPRTRKIEMVDDSEPVTEWPSASTGFEPHDPLPPIGRRLDAHGRNMLSPGWIFRHRKTGGLYRLVCAGRREAKPEEIKVMYRAADGSGDPWERPLEEWLDGRFEIVG